MCRSKELGGRRCSSHSDPVKLAAYNAHRRELYALKKHPKPQFTLIKDVAYSFNENSSMWEKYVAEADTYTEILNKQDNADALLGAVYFYTASGYSYMRDYLNGYQVTKVDKSSLEFDDEENFSLAKNVKNLDAALALVQKPDEARKVYRGMSIPASVADEDLSGWLDNNFPVNGIISQKSYMSTTLSAPKAVFSFGGDYDIRSVVFEIITKEGAVLGQGASGFGYHESEVLIPRGARFKVAGVHKEARVKVSYKKEGTPVADVPNNRTPRIVIQLMDVGDDE